MKDFIIINKGISYFIIFLKNILYLFCFGTLGCVICSNEDQWDRDLLLKANFERLQTFMPEAGVEPADYSTRQQRHAIRPSLEILHKD